MSADQDIVLVTGGNGGIGYCLASLLIADQSKHVIITSRSVEKGEAALEQLRCMGQPGTVEMLQLEVTSTASIVDAASIIEKKYGRLDALVNNAGQAVAATGTSLVDHMKQCFAVNVCGPALMIETFLPLLRKSTTTPRIVNIGSGSGSIRLTLDPDVKGGPLFIPYKASKAALNMVGAVQIAKFREAGEKIKLFTYCPGFTVSNLGPYNKLENGAKPTEEGAAPVVAILNGEKDSEHGCYLNSEGGQHPW